MKEAQFYYSKYCSFYDQQKAIRNTSLDSVTLLSYRQLIGCIDIMI